MATMDELLRTIGSRVITVDSFALDMELVLAEALSQDEPPLIVSRGRCPIPERMVGTRTASI